MSRIFKLASLLSLVAAAAWGCSGSEAQTSPNLDLTPSATTVQMAGTYNLKLSNSGDGVLILDPAPVIQGGTCPGGGSAFSLTIPAAVEFPYDIAPWDNVGVGENSELNLVITFDDPTETCDRNATLTIYSNDTEDPELVVDITRTIIEPNIIAEPNPLDLGFVPVSTIPAIDSITIQNNGLADLEIDKVEVIGFAEGFAFLWPCERNPDTTVTEPWGTDPESRISVTVPEDAASRLTIDSDVCSAPIVVKPADSVEIPVYYSAITPNAAQAIFRFHSNDPDFDSALGEAYEVTVQANVGGPCLLVSPDPIDFGSVIAETALKGVNVLLTSCGDEDLEITSLYKIGDNCGEFTFDMTGVESFDEDHPLVIAPGSSVALVAKYTPVDISQKDGDNQFIPDECIMAVDNNSPRQTVETPMIGVGVEAECAVCEFTMLVAGAQINDKAEIGPQELINFMNHSYDPTVGGGIESYNWTVRQPGDSAQVYSPASTYENPTFQPNIVGEYEFCLEVENKDGCSDSCCQSVNVVPPQGLHIELTWNTPSDPDQTDECGPGTSLNSDCGSDMDLHVVHPLAKGKTKDPATGQPYGFFDLTWDCYWMTAHILTWNLDHQDDPLYQPNLDRDDTDSAGPENFTLTKPDPDYSTTAPDCYRVGVHYYDDHLFGKAYPTIRVFINDSVPVYEKTLTAGMSMLDMWDVGRVCSSNLDTPFIERVNNDGTPHIVHGYPDESIQ